MLISLPWSLGLILALPPTTTTSSFHGPYSPENAISDAPYSLPMTNSELRSAAILDKREGFLYGPSICGNVSYWPTGPLGNLTTKRDFARLTVDLQYIQAAVKVDVTAVKGTIAAGGIKNLSDYEILYRNQWKESMPAGLDTGILSNYTNDLMFSMERLSINPYSIKRLNPSLDSLSFHVEDAIASKVAGMTLESLFKSGNLFYADHRYQAALERTDRFAAACDAYFYIHPKSGDFLPLAIRTNKDTDLVYTPADSANDWLLAKIMFNMNDVWHSQWYHLSGTHNVIEIVYEAAYRTLSDEHPVMALLERLTLELFAYRQLALEVLVNPGGFVDQLFAFSGFAAAQTTSDLYNSGVSGAFQANYLYNNLQSRGLINSAFGTKIRHFPFFEDASVIHAAIQSFMAAFVDSYYVTPAMFIEDNELQAWIVESGPAKIIDFPQRINRGTLIDILTHVAFLGSVAHHTINTNDFSEASGSLPFHPFSIYRPIPTAKGVTDIVAFLPNETQSIGQIALAAFFARPEFVKSNRSMTHMFNDTTMLARMNKEVIQAATLFQTAMQEFSSLVSSRRFDAKGLSQGMPFIWKALNPEIAPYYLTI